jgi:hypothetical protein
MFQDRIASFFYLKIFILIVIALVLGSVVFRITSEIIGSTFKNNTFSLLIVSKDSKLIFVDKNGKSVMFLALGDIRPFVKGKSTLEASFALGIPINGMIIDNKSPVNISDFITSGNELRLIFSGDNLIFKNLNRYDIYKLANAIRRSLKDNNLEVRVNLFDQKEMKEKVGEGFKDSVINNMPYTIEINNGTNVNGLGSVLAVILAREGYNIIAVKSSNDKSNSFIAYPSDRNLFTNSLFGLTGFSQKKATVSQSADVTIFLGEDLDAMLSP